MLRLLAVLFGSIAALGGCTAIQPAEDKLRMQSGNSEFGTPLNGQIGVEVVVVRASLEHVVEMLATDQLDQPVYCAGDTGNPERMRSLARKTDSELIAGPFLMLINESEDAAAMWEHNSAAAAADRAPGPDREVAVVLLPTKSSDGQLVECEVEIEYYAVEYDTGNRRTRINNAGRHVRVLSVRRGEARVPSGGSWFALTGEVDDSALVALVTVWFE